MRNFVKATNEFRGNGAPERTEYHNLVAWDRLAELLGISSATALAWDPDGPVIHVVDRMTSPL